MSEEQPPETEAPTTQEELAPATSEKDVPEVTSREEQTSADDTPLTPAPLLDPCTQPVRVLPGQRGCEWDVDNGNERQ